MLTRRGKGSSASRGTSKGKVKPVYTLEQAQAAMSDLRLLQREEKNLREIVRGYEKVNGPVYFADLAAENRQALYPETPIQRFVARAVIGVCFIGLKVEPSVLDALSKLETFIEHCLRRIPVNLYLSFIRGYGYNPEDIAPWSVIKDRIEYMNSSGGMYTHVSDAGFDVRSKPGVEGSHHIIRPGQPALSQVDFAYDEDEVDEGEHVELGDGWDDFGELSPGN